jgi:hypothetical protein
MFLKLCIFDRTKNKARGIFDALCVIAKKDVGEQSGRKKRIRKRGSDCGTDVPNNRTRETYGSMFRIDTDWSRLL